MPEIAQLHALAVHDQMLATLSDQVRFRQLSPMTLTLALLDRIAALHPLTNAFLTVTADRALAVAPTAKAELEAGRDAGLPASAAPIERRTR